MADAARGNGTVIALLLAAASAVIGIGVAARWQVRPLIGLAVALNLAYWVLGQGFGGIFEGNATDPNAGLPFVLLAVAAWHVLAPPPRPAAPPPVAARRLTSVGGDVT